MLYITLVPKGMCNGYTSVVYLNYFTRVWGVKSQWRKGVIYPPKFTHQSFICKWVPLKMYKHKCYMYNIYTSFFIMHSGQHCALQIIIFSIYFEKTIFSIFCRSHHISLTSWMFHKYNHLGWKPSLYWKASRRNMEKWMHSHHIVQILKKIEVLSTLISFPPHPHIIQMFYF